MGQDSPNLQLVVMKAAEDGDGYILRFREIAGKTGQAELAVPTLRLSEAYSCNGVEVNKEKLPTTTTTLKFPYKPNSFITLRLKAAGALQK